MIVGKKLTADRSRIQGGRIGGTGFSPNGVLPADFDFTNGGQPLTALPAILTALSATYTRNSLKNVVQNGALVALSANQFGTSYDSVAAQYGYVPEPAATNLATNSDGNAATYTVSNVADGTAVTGFTNGIAFGNNSVQRSATKATSVTSGTVYSVSVFVIMDDGNAPVVGTTNILGDFSITLNGVIATTKLERVIGSNVYRVSASITASATASHPAGITKYTGQSARTFRTTGTQVETGLRATSYIITTAATATRSADVLTVPLANITGFNNTGYTLFVDQRMDTVLAGSVIALEVHDGTSANRAYVGQAGGATPTANATSGGVAQSSLTGATFGLSRGKFAGSFSANNMLMARGGVTVTPDSVAVMPVSPTTVSFCIYAGSLPLNGYIFRAQLIPATLTQAQLNGLTT